MTEPTVWSEIGLATFAGVLRARAAERPEQVAFTYLADGESEGGRLTYAGLDRAASAIAGALRELVPAGERALLLYPPGLDFIAAFFGCLYAGVVVVPAYPPRPNDRSQSRLRAIARDARPLAALTTADILATAGSPRGLLGVAPELAAVRWIPTDLLDSSRPPATPLREPDPETVAFLQYTSGSTADPKGVMVTHANLLHNERMIGEAFGMDEDSVVVGWLPLYHDMGLIGNVLQPLYAGARCVLMPPVAFLQRPMRWLEAISHWRATTSGGPNFAYELCLRKASPEALAGVDLTSWRVAFNGAEPVRAATLERFAETFAPCGFRPEAFYPCYGLAEATLFVSGGVRGRRPRISSVAAPRRDVSCGRAWMGQRLAIADPETGLELPPGSVGEIWLSGPSVARGYWGNEEATERDFNAWLLTPDGPGGGPFLRTGDLGFLTDGELYVTGRLKDLVILRGRNHYPQDLELTAEASHPDLRSGGGAAFSVEIEGEERLVIVHEVERRRRDGFEEIAEAVRRAIAAEHEVQVHEVVLIRQGGLPKTSSGKVQRRLCKQLYPGDELPVVGRSALAAVDAVVELAPELTRESLVALAPRERRETLAAWLRELASAVLGVTAGEGTAGTPGTAGTESPRALDPPLTALGLDSLTAVELKGSVEAALGLPVPLADLLQGIGIGGLADLLLAELEMGPAVDAPPVRALSLQGDQPLSSGQRGLWFLHRLDPSGGAYNIAVAARTRRLDTVAFTRALAILTDRHEALRTVFPVVDDEPVQRVMASLLPDVQAEDAASWSTGELERRLGEEAWRPFDLAAGPLLRARFFSHGGETVLLLAVHHMVADFASLAVMAREFSVLYRQETGGPAAVLEPPVLRYGDYVRWQEELLAGPRGERLWSYWRERLEEVRDLDLPVDHPRPPVQTYRGGVRTLALPPALRAGMRSAGNATLFSSLLAVFQAQLGRYSGQEDFAVGSPTAGRPLPELAGLVGYFVNVIALRADLSSEPRFADLLVRTQRAVLEGLEHGDLPFPALAERLRPVRDPARSPVFQALFVLQQGRPQDPPALAAFALGHEGARIELGGLELAPVRWEERRSQLDLSLHVAEDGRGGLCASLEYNADLFEAATAERMLGHFRSLLEGAGAEPERSIWSLPLLAPAERRQLLEEWNETARDYPRSLLLHQLFEAQAARTPDAEALISGELRLTYRELNAEANRLAHHLRRLGVGPEDRVGLCLRRCERMIVSLFAVLKAGGAYVPLDPTYPRARLASILEDSAARVVIGEEATASRLAAESGGSWLSLDGEAERIAAQSPGDLEPLGDAGHLAYLIYTSGSTGRPKAVAIEHRSPVVLMHWAREAFAPQELAGALASTSIGFDVSVFEIFAPLSWGGRILVAENLLALPGLPAAGEVRLVCGAPSVVAELVRAGQVPTGVRTFNLGGEAVPPALVEALAAAAPGARILNVYGPSEDTTYSTFARLEPGRGVTIGVPVAGARVYLLDPRGHLVPAGVPGELFLAGEGLARGYLGRPALTAERFVPDPFAADPGSRLYRTGDLARRRPDGVLEYLGRLDHQVKVRGFRVELGEIEAALTRHPSVHEAVVVAREDGDRGQRLVAYVIPAAVPSAELRSFLRGMLPEYMVPSAFVGLERLPLSPNGKVDRRALPDPGGVAGTPATAAGAVTPVEQMVAAVMAEALGVERVGRHDDFFALGGHSLLATRLLARVSKLFGVDLPLSAVFQQPTVAGLAERVAEASRGSAAPPILRMPRRFGAGLPLSFAQRRLWFLHRLEPASPVYHLPGLVRLSGPLDLGILEAALAEVVRRHEALRTTFRLQEGEPVQVPGPPAAALPRIDLAALPARGAGSELERLARETAVTPFDLERGPVWRVLAVRLSPAEHALVLTLHHIVADGWSLRILFAELAALYQDLVAGSAPPPLPELPVQYADWAVWQREWLRGSVLAAEVAWWRERLAGIPELSLPADRPRAAARSARGGTRTVSLPADLSADLEGLARREGATPFMALLAAFQAQLARHAGASVIPLGSPVANRGRAEIEGLIGFFVNMLVLCTPIDGSPSFRELLARVREVCLGAYTHQDVPFERLVEELRPERRRGRNPLFQAVFQLEEPLAVERLGEAVAEVRRVETGTAKFDLYLSVVREPQGFAATLEYDADLFDAATADRLLGQWRTLLEEIAADPEARLRDLPLAAPAEAEEIRSPRIAGYVSPSTDVEERLAAVWRDVLGIERVGVHDDFFDLGGHSLLAHRVVMRIAEEMELELELQSLFECPTVATLAERVSSARTAGTAARALSVVPQTSYPLSFAQQRLWLLDLIEPGSAKYNVPVAVRLQGALEIGVLARTLAEIVRRHEPLRTVYARTGGEPVQVVLPPPGVDGLGFAHVDLRGLPAPAREQPLREALRDEAARPFDLAQGPVARFLLVESGPQDHALLATFHHIATDGWSMEVFFRELAVLYGDFAAGREPSLPEPPLRYVDWAAWQRRAFAEGALDSQLTYWRRQLADLPVLELPVDRSRSAASGERGANRRVSFADEPIGKLRGLGSGITSFNVLLAGFAALLSRLSGQDDVAVGLTAAGRDHRHLEELIGFFVNTLVARIRVEDDPAFGMLVERVREVVLAAQAHQDVPFERLVEELQPERAEGVTPLFQAAFTYLASPLAPVPMPGLAVKLLDVETAVAKFDLTLSVYHGEEGLSGWVEYRTGLFEPATIERWMGHLRTLLAGAAADPSRRLYDLPLLTAAEQQELQRENGEVVESLGSAAHQALEEQARRAPDAPAVITAGGEILSRGELDARANRLANHLLALGLRPEQRVAVCLEQSSPDLLTAAFAVLKAGGTYVPLDPTYPAERIRVVLEDSAAAILITRGPLLDRLPVDAALGLPLLVLVDRNAEAVAARAASHPAVEVDPCSLAYVIYTSGSTGHPKGVGVPHGAVAAHVAALSRIYGVGEADRVLQFASPGFDVSVEQLLAHPALGATLVLRPEGPFGTHELIRLLRERELTFINLPTAFWHRWVRECVDLAEAPAALRTVLAGGEEMLAASVALWERSPLRETRLLNGYGPTETVVTATIREILQQDGERGPVAIGRPFPGRSGWVLDRRGNLAPVGVPGELCLAGPMARGYLGRPDATAERFVPDPFSGRPGGRLYRTGDRARRRPDGALEFLGRLDEQVKIRGIRIEPGEIEAALTAHPDVQEAAVVAIDGPEGDRRLAAYVAPVQEGAAGLPAALRAFLRERLPEAMVPSAWRVLPSLPLNVHGKVDLAALPSPAFADGETGGGSIFSTPESELVAGLFAEVLGRERVGTDDSFFDLGGHSLLATQLAFRIRAAFGLELPLAAVFEAPTPAALAKRLEEIRRAPGTEPPPPLVHEEGAEAPLSFAQQRLWFLHQLEPDDAYHVPGALRLRGALREDVLERTLAEIVRRHAALRTVFRPAKGAPVQVVLPPAALRLPVTDLTALPAEERETEAGRLLAREARRPFDLAAGPPVRLLLVRLAEEERLLAVVTHHIVSDAWSLGVLLRELGGIYTAFMAGEPSPLPELPVQYADFARWQRRWLSGQVLEREVAHWRRALAGAPESLELPYARPPAAARNLGGRRPCELPAGLWQPLLELARRDGWTPFMALLAGFQALLSRYSGQDDVVVGSPIANRTRLEQEGLIGFFTNTLALRLDLSGDPSFWELGRRVRAVALEAYAHQDLPFEKLVEELAPDRHLGRNPLFETLLVLQKPPVPPALPGVESELLDVETGAAKFDLILMLTEAEGGARGVLEYARDLFDEGTVDRVSGHLRTLLAAAVADPGRRLSELPLLTEAERAELAAWSRPLVSEPRRLCVHEGVAAQAVRTPGAVAVTDGRESLTYGELMARSRRLARRLREAGVDPDVPVGLFLERSLDMAVAVLGVLEAGGAYLPLDPAYPAERLRLMLEDALAPVLVTHAPLAGAVPQGTQRIVRVDELNGRGEALAPAAGVTPDHLAYVIYTSGSTGRPKGVAMTHGAISAMLLWQLRTSAAGAGRTLQFTSLSFDVSFQEIFSTWWAGGTLVLVSEEVRREPAALARWMAEQRVERLFLPFVALQQVAMAALEGDGALPASLREVMSAGEQLFVTPQVAELFSRLPGAALHNHYGPSEAHAVTWLSLQGEPRRWPERPAIGLPVDHARVFLLDADLQPAPVGVPGEIWVGGAGLARGYQSRPDLTAERFLPDPFDWAAGWRPGDRLYRTGDLARRRADGGLEFLGRRDSQVKIRGHRVELSEVETALARHPAVQQAAVAVLGETSGARRLAAYVVPRGGMKAPAPGELREFLAASLPDAMVPTAWARVDALPLTATGKLDRGALSRIAPEEGSGDGELTPRPRTPAEDLLAGIWGEVLGVARVGLHDDFFHLGGHSLLATQVASRIREAFGVDLPLRRIFEASTLAGMAAAIVDVEGGAAPAPPILRVPRGERLPLSFGQERLWFLDRLQPGSSAYNVPLAVRVEGRLDVRRLAGALSAVARRHEVLRTVFAERDGGPVQVVLPAAEVPLPAVDLRGLPLAARETEARRLTAEEAMRPFDLASGPLLRCALLELAPERALLVLNLHHIATDGWSMGVLVREINALYAGSALPELPVQYADFAAWQRRWLAGETLDRQLAWWRERLHGAPSALELPADHPRPPVLSQRGAEHRFALSGELSRGIAELARREAVTPFMVLAAGLFALLSRLTDQRDLTIGSPIANRNHLATEALIGFFVNTLVLRADLSRTAVFRDLLRQVREVSLGAYAHQDLPFEKLVDELHPERDLSRSPLFQVALALQNAPLPAADLGAVHLVPEEILTGVAKFDLSFVFVEAGEGLLTGLLQYATDLFESATAARYAGHLAVLLGELVARPRGRLSEMPLLAAAERQQILGEWNDTRVPLARDLTLGRLFEERADLEPQALAAVWEGESLTYGGLEARANRLARLLRDLGAGPGTPVGVWLERSLDMIVAVLGILKAGGHYLPLDASWPAERAEAILAASRAPIIVTRSALLARVLEAQWRLPLADVVCLDVDSSPPPAEPVDAGEVRALWDFVAERAVDRVSAGGFVSSYTGLPFSEPEVDEYRDRVLSLAAPWLRPDARVLEIGCGSGLILWEMAPRVASAVGLDPSALTQERNRAYAAERGIANVELRTGFAHEIDELPAAAFDLVVLASTVQFFPGPLYLERVVEQALRRLAPGGALLVADVPDARRKTELQQSLGAAARANTERIRWFDEDLFRDLGASVHHRREGFANELRFRYDVLMTRGERDVAAPRAKRLWTGWHVERCPAERPPVPVSPDDFAYVIHTSGSTGEPKGIGVQHRPAVGLIDWVNGTFGVGPRDRLLFTTSLGFDLSVYDIFGTLAAGGTIHVVPEAALRDPVLLAAMLRDEPVTLWDSAPAALQQLAPLFPAREEAIRRRCPLRLVLLSGDWIPVGLPDQVRTAFPAARVIGLGGATEATVWSNRYPIGEVDPRWPSIPYGRPIANARYYVLDAALSPCPVGVPGDLHIGGDVLCTGYVYQPDLTAAQFLPDPFAGPVRKGARMYRTGDRARYGVDGNLEFLGRIDHQVKIRGYRIELGEIEVALSRHSGVREAVVLAREDIPGEKRLAGYVVPSRQPAPTAAELREFLLATLPEYMVPWAFVELPAFPVTTNGKLDRAALPAPQASPAAGGGAYVAPRNELERAIARVWREVLQVERVGVKDNFFESGGSSLLIVKLHARLKEALGRDVPVMELFRHSTIDALARKLAEEGEAPPAVEETAGRRARTRQESLRQMQEARAGRRRGTRA